MSEVKIDNRGVPAVSIIDAMSEINADKIFNEESGRGPGISERIGERRSRSEKRSRCHNPCGRRRYQTPLPHPEDKWSRPSQAVLRNYRKGDATRADASALSDGMLAYSDRKGRSPPC